MENRGDSPAGLGFEMQVYEAVRRALDDGRLGLLKNSCKVFHRKEYFSRDRGKPIITDVSIEIFIEDGSHPAILWIWECKDYSGRVPVDDVEEFHAKLEQIGADKTKGTLIARGAYQRSAISYAQAKGIGMARFLSPNQIDWSFHTRVSSSSNNPAIAVEDMLLQDEVLSRGESIFGFTTEGEMGSARSLSGFVFKQLTRWFSVESKHEKRST